VITKNQIRAARCLLGWRRTEAAKFAELPVAVILEIERGTVAVGDDALNKLRGCYEAAGIRFLDDCGITQQRSCRCPPAQQDNPPRPANCAAKRETIWPAFMRGICRDERAREKIEAERAATGRYVDEVRRSSGH
jgi:hypothetical protein